MKRSFTTTSLAILLVGNTVLVGLLLALELSAAALIGLAAVVTLGIWFGIRTVGVRAIEVAEGQAAKAPERPAVEAKPEPKAPPKLQKPEQPPEASAIQVLGLFQRKGRLIDFLQEDIQAYQDAQIGAAVRAVHEGCKAVLDEHVMLEPIMDEAEGQSVTVEPGFDAHAVRLTGHVAGDPPFTGTVQHRGWRVARIELPELMHKQDRVVAAAEVEVR